MTTLITKAENLNLHHSGPQLMLNHWRQNVLTVYGKLLVLKVVRNYKKGFQVKQQGI